MKKRKSIKVLRKLKLGQKVPSAGSGPIVAKASVFLPDSLAQVKLIAMQGLSDDEIAERFGVEKVLFQRWKKAYPSFAKAIADGRADPDIEVTQSLFKRAVGYEYQEDGLTRTGSIRSLKRHLPGDVGAIRLWLTNRQSDHWQLKSTTAIEGGREGSPPVSIESRQELIAGILALVKPKPDGPSKPPPEK